MPLPTEEQPRATRLAAEAAVLMVPDAADMVVEVAGGATA